MTEQINPVEGDGESESVADGHRIRRDPSTGRIVASELSSDRAAAIGRSGGKTTPKETLATAEELHGALVAVLVDEHDERAPALKMLLGLVAREAARNGSKALQAIQTGLSLVGATAKSSVKPPAGPHDPCSVCGRTETPIYLSEGACRTIAAALSGQLRRTNHRGEVAAFGPN